MFQSITGQGEGKGEEHMGVIASVVASEMRVHEFGGAELLKEN